MSAPNSYWTWDSNRKDYYHAEKLQNGTTRYTWASSLNSSGTAQQQGHNSPTSNVPRTPFVTHTSSIPQPREPYGVSASGIAIPYRPATSASLAAPHSAVSLPSTSRVVPGTHATQVAYPIKTSSPPVVTSAGPQISQQPWRVEPRDQYGTTSNRTSSVRVPGSDPLPVGLRNPYNGRSSSSYTYGQGSGTGIASPGQAASQPLAPRTTGDSTSPFVSPVQMNAGLDDASGQIPVAGIARTGQAARQPFSSRTASHSISVSSSPLQNRAQLHDTNTQGQYRSAIPVPDKSKPDPSREALYPKRTSSVTVHTTKGEFKYIKYKTKKFFVVGKVWVSHGETRGCAECLFKVFMIYHIENAGATSDPNQLVGPSFTTVAFGEHAHHQFRRFVVVKEMSNEFYCYCW
ncbi:MAG: hypothetical protein Q9195_004224 [Heterodermia aff. obscurata]